MLRVEPDGTAAGCGGAWNANFVQGPYEAGRGPGGAGMVGGGTGRRGSRSWQGAECDLRAKTL